MVGENVFRKSSTFECCLRIANPVTVDEANNIVAGCNLFNLDKCRNMASKDITAVGL